MSNVGTIDLELSTNTSPFQRELDGIAGQATNMVGGAFMKLGGIIAAAFAVDKLVDFGKSSIELASNLQEVQNVVDVTFGSMAQQVNDFSKTAITKFGISELSAKKFASTMGAMLKSSGLSGQQMTNMSLGIAGLSADMASFYNLKPQEAFDKIRSGISGETEPLKELGVNMSVANMEAYALSQGITTSYAKMNQASQSLLRYNYLLSVTKDAQGDFARTSGSWANQTRLLSEQWNIMKTTMGQGFINALTPLLSVINKIIARLQVAAQYFKAFTEMIFGNAVAVATGEQAGAAIVGANATDKLGNSADTTAGKVKKAAAAIKGSLGAFDQLNVLGQKANDTADDAGAGGVGDSVGSTPAISVGKPSVDLGSSMKDAVDKFLAPLKEISFQPLMDSLGRLKTALEPFAKTLFAGLEWAWNNVLVPLAKWTITQALPAFFNALAGAATILNPLLLSFKPLGEWLWVNFLQPIATWTGGIIVSVLNGIGEALTKVGNWMSTHQTIVDGITTSVVLFFAAWKGIELLAFIQMSGGVVAALKNIAAAIKAGTIAKIADKLETMALTAMYAKDLVVSVVSGTAAFLKQTAQVILLSISMAAQTVATGAYAVAAGIATAATWLLNAALAVLTSPITLVIAAIALLGLGIYELVKHWDDVKAAGAKAWEWIKEKWNEASAWFGEHIVAPIKSVFSGLWDGVKNIFKEGANVAIGALEAFVNFAIRGLNKVIYGWNLAKSAMGISGWTMPIEEIHIPRLANGGLVSQPTLAMVGDNRNASQDPEVVSPLSKLQGMLGGDTKELVEVMKQVLSAIQNQSMSLKIGESEFARLVGKCIDNEQRRTGKPLFQV